MVSYQTMSEGCCSTHLFTLVHYVGVFALSIIVHTTVDSFQGSVGKPTVHLGLHLLLVEHFSHYLG